MPDVWERFASRVTPQDGCLVWTGGRNRGYGRFYNAGQRQVAHRWLFEQLFWPVPQGLELDHLCRMRACVDPMHLEPVTHRVNMLRSPVSKLLPALMLAKTHCPSGHEYSGANLTVRPNGERRCKACAQARNRADREGHRRKLNEVKVPGA